MARPLHLRTAALPTDHLDPIEILDLTRFISDEVNAGKFPFVRFTEPRWHRRIYRDPSVDVWLISWLPTQGTTLHDHGGSRGGFTVVSGELTESVYRSGRVEDVCVCAGSSVGFDAHRVHDVRNVSGGPALSVHAYSPPLTSMTYYDVRGGRLHPRYTRITDHPEGESPAEEAS